MHLRFVYLLLLIPLVAGCSAYHPLKDGTGFRDEAVGAKEYRVTYRAAEEMPVNEASRYALVRAAEITVRQHEAYFEIQEQKVQLAPRLYYRPAISRSFTTASQTGISGGVPVNERLEMSEYSKRYAAPEVTLRVRIVTAASEKSVPAVDLIQQAIADHIPVSSEASKEAARLPAAKEPVNLPPAPTPSTGPATP